MATVADRIFGSSFLFNAGSTRDTTNPEHLPRAPHLGPTFGSLNASTVDLGTATLNGLDAVAVADVDDADGFLTLGDSGQLIMNFAPEVPIPISESLFLMFGEVGGQEGEGLGGFVTVSDDPVDPIPEPGTLLLLGTGLAGFVGYTKLRLRRRKKA